MTFPDKALPEWIERYQADNWTDICRAKKAIRIAWEALESVNIFSNDLQLIKENKAAMEKIRALGDK